MCSCCHALLYAGDAVTHTHLVTTYEDDSEVLVNGSFGNEKPDSRNNKYEL